MIHEQFSSHVQPPLYLTHRIPSRPLVSVRFTPFQDILAIGHNVGISSILVPGCGEPNFDSTEADPFENRKARGEREIRGLLDKVLHLDFEFSYKQITEIFLIDRFNQTLLLSTQTPLVTLSKQTQSSLRLTENRQLIHLLRGYLVLTDYVLLERLIQLKIPILPMSLWELKEQRWTRGRGSSWKSKKRRKEWEERIRVWKGIWGSTERMLSILLRYVLLLFRIFVFLYSISKWLIPWYSSLSKRNWKKWKKSRDKQYWWRRGWLKRRKNRQLWIDLNRRHRHFEDFVQMCYSFPSFCCQELWLSIGISRVCCMEKQIWWRFAWGSWSNTSKLDLLTVSIRGGGRYLLNLCCEKFESAGTTWFQVNYLVTDDCATCCPYLPGVLGITNEEAKFSIFKPFPIDACTLVRNRM